MPTFALSPGAIVAAVGPTPIWYGCSPCRKDGGASEGLLPHALSGVAESVYSSRPPSRTRADDSQGRSLVRPLTFRERMYGASAAAPAARMEMSLPLGLLISMRGNIG